MARFDVSGLDETIEEMKRLGQMTGRTADAKLMAGADEVRKAWKRSAEEHRHRDTGDMIASIGFPRTPKDVGSIRTIDIYPQGKDKRNIRNAEKAFILHYGTTKIRGSRWVDDADKISEQTVVPAMIRVWEQFLQNQ